MSLKKAAKNIRSLAMLLLCVYLLSCIRVYLPYFNYIINYNYIENELCENKNKPVMHCNGKCHLLKEIKKAEAEESSNGKAPAALKIIVFQEIAVEALQFHQLHLLPLENKYCIYNNKYISPSLKISSPPPQAA